MKYISKKMIKEAYEQGIISYDINNNHVWIAGFSYIVGDPAQEYSSADVIHEVYDIMCDLEDGDEADRDQYLFYYNWLTSELEKKNMK